MEQIHVIQQCSPLSHQIASYRKLGNDIHTDEPFFISDSAKQSISCGDIMKCRLVGPQWHVATDLPPISRRPWVSLSTRFRSKWGILRCGPENAKAKTNELLTAVPAVHLVSSTRAVGCRHWSISCCICGEITCRNKN